MRSIYFLLALCFSVVMIGSGVALAQGPTVNGLTTVQVEASVDETVGQLQNVIQERGLILVSTVDHAANAQGVGEELRPTQLLIFGNPTLGTQLMQDQQTVAIDLPQKFLVWEDENGQVNVSYNDPQYLSDRHDLQGSDEVLTTITNALGGLANSVTPAAVSAPEALPATGADHSLIPWLLMSGGVTLMGLAWLVRRRSHGRGWPKLLASFIAIPLLALIVSGPVATAQSQTNGLVTVDSAHNVDETVSRLQTEMEARGLTVMMTINHAMNAENVGMELRPTQLIIFGNPALGTQLMQSGQTVAIDLPQKFLIWEDADGQVHVTYNDPQYIAQRHNISDRDDVLMTVGNALSGLAEAATAP